jgi:glucose-1-phosphate thymidylyltransferase
LKGIILCGGKGERLQPITYTTPKQLLPLANKPLLVYTIELLLNSGINEIGIVVNENNKSIFQSTLGRYFNHDFQYIIQENPQGIGHGLLFAEKFVGNEKFVMVLGDNSFDTSLKKFIVDFITSKTNCKILLKAVDNPERYGVAYIGNDKIISLEEKPKRAFSNWAITGVYAFDKNIFKALREIKISSYGEYEITDAIKWLLQNGYDIDYEILEGYWRDVGSPKDVVEENINRLSFIHNDIKGELVNSQISGKVHLEEGAVIYNSVIRGPIVVGESSIIKYSYIGPYTSIGKGVNIDKSIIENSIIFDDCVISGVDVPIENSIVGEGSIINNEKGFKKANRFVTGKNTKISLSNL